MTEDDRYRRTTRQIDRTIVGANMMGVLMVVFYFVYIQGRLTPDRGGQVSIGFSVGLAAACIFLGSIVGGRLSDPTLKAYQQIVQGELEDIPQSIQRTALNMPLILGGVSLSMWVLAGLVVGTLQALDLAGVGFYWTGFFSSLVGMSFAGQMTSWLIYFIGERLWRSEVPLFFPNQDLTKIPAFRMTVRRRISILLALTGLPVLQLALISYLNIRQILQMENPVVYLPYLLLLQLFFVFVEGFISLTLAPSVGSALVHPLEDLSRRMTQVAEGNLEERAEVTSNDEPGILAARFNFMVSSLQQRNLELQSVYQISQEITSSLELEQTLTAILERVRQMVSCDAAEICLYNELTGLLETRATAGAEGILVDPVDRIYQPGEGYTGQVGQQQQSVLVLDTADQPENITRSLIDGMQMRSYLGVPLLLRHTLTEMKLIGTLALGSAHPGAFDEHSRQLLQTIAPQAAIAVQNATQVLERERKLKAQIEQLRIEIDQNRQEQSVQEITETDYFQRLQASASQMRRSRRGDKSE